MTAAEAQLSDLAAKLDDLGAKSISPAIILDDTGIVAALDDLGVKLDKLNDEVTNVRLTLEDADIGARLDDIGLKLDDIGARDVTPRLGLDDSSFNRQLDEDKAKLDAMGASSAGGGGGLGSAGLIGGAVLGGLAASPALPGALAGGGAAIGTLGLAVQGIDPALQAYTAMQTAAAEATGKTGAAAISAASQIRSAQQAVSQAETQASHDAVTSAEAIKNAQAAVAQAQTQAANDAITSAETVKNAQTAVAQAVTQAANSQVTAEQQLANAQYAEQQAQIQLTDARQQAILTLQQLNNSSADAALGAKQAALDLQQATLNQQTTDASATSTALQKAQADLSVQEAQQRLTEANQAQVNTANAATKANQEGVNGLPAVVAAQHGLAQAHQSTADAQRNLANVEQQGAAAITKAQQALTDAVRNASLKQQSDAAAIAKAQQSVADASRNAAWQQQGDATSVANAQAQLQTAYAKAGTGSTSAATAAKAYQVALANLSPAGQEMVKEIIGLESGLKGLEGVAQTAIAPGFTAFLQGVHDLLPTISGEVSSMGKILGGFLTDLGKGMQTSGFQTTLKALFDEGNQFLKIVVPAIGEMLGAIFTAGAKSPQAVKGLADGLAAIARGIGDLVKNLVPAAPALGSALSNLGKLLGGMGGPAGTVLADELRVISGFLGFIAKLPPGVSSTLTDFVATILVLKKTGVLSLGLKIAGIGLGGGAEAAGSLGLWSKILPGVTLAAGALTAFVLLKVGSIGTKPGQNPWDNPFGADPKSKDPSKQGVSTWVGLGHQIEAATDGTREFIVGSWNQTFAQVSAIIAKISSFLSGSWSKMMSDVKSAWDAISNFITGSWDKTYSAVSGAIGRLISFLAGSWSKMMSDARSAWNAIASFFTSIWNTIYQTISSAIGKVISFLTSSWTKTTSDVKSAWNAISAFFTSIWNTIYSAISGAVAKVISFFTTSWNMITSGVKSAWNAIASFFTSIWNTIYNTFSSIIGKISSFLSGGWNTMVTAAKNIWNGLVSWVTSTLPNAFQSAFQGIVNGVSSVWSTLKTVAEAPIKYIIDVIYDQGIVGVVKEVGGLIGLSLPTIHPGGLAAGGKITEGTTPTADDVLARVSKNETVVSAAHSQILAPAFAAVGVPGYATGGIPNPIGFVLHEATSAWKAAMASLKGLTGDAVAKAAKIILDPMVNAMPGGGTSLGAGLKKIPETIVDDLVAKLETTTAGVSGSVGGGSGADVAKYAASFATGHGHPYVWGGSSPSGWDCSGMSADMYEHFGYFPEKEGTRHGTSQSQFSDPLLQSSGAVPGALAFFNGSDGPIGHVGIVLNPSSYVSAYDTAEGTVTKPIAGALGFRIPKGGFQSAGALNPAQAQAYASAHLAAHGWDAGQMSPLVALWNQECVPLRVRILTRRGWLTCDEVQAGDETIGYNPQTGRSEWTKITAVNKFGPTPVKRFGNQYWSAECTANHRWLAEDMGTQCRYGPRPGRVILERREVIKGESLVELADLRKSDRVVLARPAHSDTSLPISVREAALLGWIAGDGSVSEPRGYWRDRKAHVELAPTPEAPFGYRRDGQPKKNRSGAPRKTGQYRTSSGLAVRITQAKPEHFAAIDDACASDPDCGHGTESRIQYRDNRRDVRIWRISAAYSRDLLARAGNPKTDAVAQVLAMSDDQRAAWLTAITAAEGTSLGGGRVLIYQDDGPIADAIELAIYMSGKRPSRGKDARNGKVAWRLGSVSPHVGGKERRRFIEDAGTKEVWCPTTELGTWTADQDGQVFLTGNSGWNRLAKNPSSGAYGIPQSLPASKMGTAANPPTSSASAQIDWGLGYIKSTYGDPAGAEAHEVANNWYDNGGWLPPGLSLTHNNTGRPEPILSGAQWDLIGSAAHGGDGAAMGGRAMAKRFDRMIHLLEMAPGRTAGGLGEAINGTARNAVQRGYFRTR